MKEKDFKGLGNIIISGILAFIFLTLFCHFYYNIPVHKENQTGSTDYKWESHAFYSRGTEGFAWGKTNNDGHTNLFDYEENMKIDVLIMGSSHMEAYQVNMEDSTASKLNALLEEDTVYNIGISDHTFLRCAGNLKAALTTYHPTKYVVLETDNLSFSNAELRRAIHGTTAEIPSHTGGIVNLIQHNPYLRLMYAQMQNYTSQQTEGIESAEDTTIADKSRMSKKKARLMNKLFRQMSDLAEEFGTKIIIVYHPRIQIASDGALQLSSEQSPVQQVQKICENNSILFLDMSNRFREEYDSDYTLPYGFSNSPVGSGHLNKYGHAMIADELYHLISREKQ